MLLATNDKCTYSNRSPYTTSSTQFVLSNSIKREFWTMTHHHHLITCQIEFSLRKSASTTIKFCELNPQHSFVIKNRMNYFACHTRSFSHQYEWRNGKTREGRLAVNYRLMHSLGMHPSFASAISLDINGDWWENVVIKRVFLHVNSLFNVLIKAHSRKENRGTS